MSTLEQPLSLETMKAAIEGRDGRMLASFYRDDAVVRVVDRDHPPSHPQEIRGRKAIDAYWTDICGRAMTHAVDSAVSAGDDLAYAETCTYPDGVRVLAMTMMHLREGRIADQTVVQAWDS